MHAHGTDITRRRAHARARLGIAYVPQGREIFPALSVTDNLRMGLVETGQQGSGGIERLLADFPRLKPRSTARAGRCRAVSSRRWPWPAPWPASPA